MRPAPTKVDVALMVLSIITKLLALKQDEIQLESDLRKDLSANSLDLLEMRMQLEIVFNSTFQNVDLESMHTISQIVDVVWENVSRGTATMPLPDKVN